MKASKTNFVKRCEPCSQAQLELKTSRILGVINGRSFNSGTSITMQDGGIMDALMVHMMGMVMVITLS